VDEDEEEEEEEDYDNDEHYDGVGQKVNPYTDLSIIASYARKTLLFCTYTNSGTTASYIKFLRCF